MALSAQAAPLSRADRWWAAALASLVAAWFLVWAQGTPDVVDAEIAQQTAGSLARHGSLALAVEPLSSTLDSAAARPADTPEARALVERARGAAPGAFALLRGPDGGWRAWYAPGQALLLVPFHAAGALAARCAPATEAAHAARIVDGVARSEWWAHAVASWSNPLCAAALAACAFLVARRLGASRTAAAWAASSLVLATLLAPLSRGMLSDVPAALCLCVALERWLAARAAGPAARGAWLGMGLALGAAVATRVQLAPAALALAAAAVLGAAPRVRVLCLVAVPFGAGCALVALANHARSGDWTDLGYGAVFAGGFWSQPPLEGLWKLLASPGRGLLWSSSGVLLALAGLWSARDEQRLVVRTLACAALLVVLPIACTVAWHGGHVFGPRYVLAALVLVWPFAALCLDRLHGAARLGAHALLVAGALLQLPFMAVDAATWHAAAIEHQRVARPDLVAASTDPVVRDEALFQAALVDWQAAPLVTVPRLWLAQRSAPDTGAVRAGDVWGDGPGSEQLFVAPERARGGRHLLWVDAAELGVPWIVPVLLVALLLACGAVCARLARQAGG